MYETCHDISMYMNKKGLNNMTSVNDNVSTLPLPVFQELSPETAAVIVLSAD